MVWISWCFFSCVVDHYFLRSGIQRNYTGRAEIVVFGKVRDTVIHGHHICSVTGFPGFCLIWAVSCESNVPCVHLCIHSFVQELVKVSLTYPLQMPGKRFILRCLGVDTYFIVKATSLVSHTEVKIVAVGVALSSSCLLSFPWRCFVAVRILIRLLNSVCRQLASRENAHCSLTVTCCFSPEINDFT